MAVLQWLDEAYRMGVRQVLCGNLGHVALARSRGMEVRGDFGFNAFNSRAMAAAAPSGAQVGHGVV